MKDASAPPTRTARFPRVEAWLQRVAARAFRRWAGVPVLLGWAPTQQAGDAAATTPAQLEQAEKTPSAGPQWVALVGRRIALGQTGFMIVLSRNPFHSPYSLVDPEGRVLAMHMHLQLLKYTAEQFARDRAEFDLVGAAQGDYMRAIIKGGAASRWLNGTNGPNGTNDGAAGGPEGQARP